MFLGASVYVALMVLVLKVSGTIVAGWRLGGRSASDGADGQSLPNVQTAVANAVVAGGAQTASGASAPSSPLTSDRVRAIVDATRVPANDTGQVAAGDRRAPVLAAATRSYAAEQPVVPAARIDRRVQGVGARFRSPPIGSSGKSRS
jgi:type IV secretion system protein VirB6